MGPNRLPAVAFTQTGSLGLGCPPACPLNPKPPGAPRGEPPGKAPEPTWKVRSQSCSSGGGATEGMRRRRAWPALALRRSPKVVVGLGMQGPSVLDHSRGETEAKVRHAKRPGPHCANSSQDRGPHKPPAASLPPSQPPSHRVHHHRHSHAGSPRSPALRNDRVTDWLRLEAPAEVARLNPLPRQEHPDGFCTSPGPRQD